MDLSKQKNFYDVRRQFQGKDQPTDPHPQPMVAPVAKSQIVFGLLFLGFLGALFALRVKAARDELRPAEATAPKLAQPAAAQK